MAGLQPILIMKNVSKDYGNRKILRDINLQLTPNDFVYLVGKNGAGKSTTLNLIRHEEIPDKGNISIGNYKLNDLGKKDIPYLRREIGYIFQDLKLVDDATVKENLVYPLEALGYSDRLIKERYQDVLNIVGLYDLRNSIAGDLSGGEKRKVTLARAIINKPELLLADEPTASLDPVTADDVMKILEKINKSGTAILMVTHDFNLINEYPHNTIELRNHHLHTKEDLLDA